MPPYRATMSTMPKPLKTERTHEENQERAYIAASRRSDRSLEARLESARRASEIHKKRTGRALRVTEQDVLNEEMYEEEDDDIPFAYRRMTAHMQIDNPEFHRKFQAYMATQMESRRQLTQAVMNSYQQNPTMYGQGQGHPQSPFMGSSNMMQMPSPTWQQGGAMPPQMFNRGPSANSTQRAGPYPGANGMQQHMRPASHGRSMSIANPQNMSMQQQSRAGSYSSHTAHSSPIMTKREGTSPRSTSSAGRKSPLSQTGNKRKREDDIISPTAHKDFASNGFISRPDQQHQRHHSYAGALPANPDQVWSNSMAPFTTALPANTQDILSDNPHFDMSDPTMSMMMPPQQQPFSYSYNPNGKPKHVNGMGQQSSTQGLNQTLTLDTHPDPKYDALPSAGTDYLDSAALDPSYNFGGFGQDLFGPNSGFNSGAATPGDNGWMDSYLQDSFEIPEAQHSLG